MASYLHDRYQRVSMKDNNSNKYSSNWVHVKHGVPQGSVLGPLLFLIYINDFSTTIRTLANPILFADDTSVIISNLNPIGFKSNINAVLTITNNWFHSNLLRLNYDKTHFLQFLTKNQSEFIIPEISNKKVITDICSIRFLGLIIDNTLTWKEHIITLTSKLNKACYAIRAIKPFVSLDVLKMTYFSYVHSLMSYGIIFWGDSVHSKLIFKIQKRIIRIITNSNRRDSCRQLYKQLQILPLKSQYIFSLLLFVVKNRDLFQSNSQIHNINTRYNYDLHLPSANLTLFQRGVLYSGSRIYNHLPLNIKSLSNDVKHFKSTLKNYLLENSFYSVEEFFQRTY